MEIYLVYDKTPGYIHLSLSYYTIVLGLNRNGNKDVVQEVSFKWAKAECVHLQKSFSDKNCKSENVSHIP